MHDISDIARPNPNDLSNMQAEALKPHGQYDHLLAAHGNKIMLRVLVPEPNQVTIAETETGEKRLFAVDGQEEKYQRLLHEPYPGKNRRSN